MIEIEMQTIMGENKMAFIAKVDMSSSVKAELAHVVVREIALQIASRYVAENFQQIVELMSQEAIATLSVAEATAKVRAMLDEKLPDKIATVEKEKQVILQRGILGGIKRIL